MRTKEEIKKELSQLDLEIAELCFSSERGEKYDGLSRKAKALREEMRFLDYKLIATDYEIDIYENPVEKCVKYYRITPHGMFQEIGFIKISYGVAARPRMGNIGYEIDKNYRGHNYTIKALEMLVDEMLSKQLESPTIAAYPSNTPSVRIIEKFGGEVIHQAENKYDWNIYRVNLKQRKQIPILKKINTF